MTQLIILMTGEARSGKDTSAAMLADKIKAHGLTVTTTFFAKALKTSLKSLFCLNDDHVFGDLKETPIFITTHRDRLYPRLMKELKEGSLRGIAEKMSPMLPIDMLADRILNRMIATIKEKATKPFPDEDIWEASPRQLMQWWGTEAVREGAYQDAWIDCAVHDINSVACNVAIVSDCRFDNEALKMHEHFDLPTVVYTIEIVRGEKVAVAKHVSEAGLSRNLIDKTIENNDTLAVLNSKLDKVINILL